LPKQLAADGFNLVLVARRLNLLEAIGKQLAKEQHQISSYDRPMKMQLKKLPKLPTILKLGF
jgi:short-subunit dehydrogenase